MGLVHDNMWMTHAQLITKQLAGTLDRQSKTGCVTHTSLTPDDRS